MPPSSTRPPFRSRRNTRPSVIPAARVQRSMEALIAAATGTTRSLPPLPTRSTMTLPGGGAERSRSNFPVWPQTPGLRVPRTRSPASASAVPRAPAIHRSDCASSQCRAARGGSWPSDPTSSCRTAANLLAGDVLKILRRQSPDSKYARPLHHRPTWRSTKLRWLDAHRRP
jgi:hypothetical protein